MTPPEAQQQAGAASANKKKTNKKKKNNANKQKQQEDAPDEQSVNPTLPNGEQRQGEDDDQSDSPESPVVRLRFTLNSARPGDQPLAGLADQTTPETNKYRIAERRRSNASNNTNDEWSFS
ncbi:hypothetical protein PG993_007625 [Apiospora rasikravindrae]|uniref:Uncharacterized protein n=1 Tax=Apiospora rasikravindrae TaxID=990691 RepID=A0ABR1SZV5_9PEZI